LRGTSRHGGNLLQLSMGGRADANGDCAEKTLYAEMPPSKIRHVARGVSHSESFRKRKYVLKSGGHARAINPIALAPNHETKISRVSLCGIAPKVHIDVHADHKRARIN
jgi:hypothetical protein